MRRIVVALLLVAGTLVVSGPRSYAAVPFVHVSAAADVPGGTNGFALKAKCPRRTRVVSGGVEINGLEGLGAIVGSYPYDSRRDRGKTPDDGWVGVVHNFASEPRRMRTYATCSRLRTFVYLSADRNVRDATTSVGVVDCPDGAEPIGGGLRFLARSHKLLMHASIPFARDADDVRNDAWLVGVYNASGASVDYVLHAICTTDNLSHTADTMTLQSGNTGGLEMACAAGREVVGGGVSTFGSESVLLQTDKPLWGSPTTVEDDGWLALVSNQADFDRDVTAAIICKAVA